MHSHRVSRHRGTEADSVGEWSPRRVRARDVGAALLVWVPGGNRRPQAGTGPPTSQTRRDSVDMK